MVFPELGLGFCALYLRMRIQTACNGSLVHRNVILYSFVVHRHSNSRYLSCNPQFPFGDSLSTIFAPDRVWKGRSQSKFQAKPHDTGKPHQVPEKGIFKESTILVRGRLKFTWTLWDCVVRHGGGVRSVSRYPTSINFSPL